MTRLEALIAALKQLPESQRFEWAKDIAERSVDGELQTPVRMPLFREVLFPALVSGIQAKEPGCARWLAGFSQLFYKHKDGQPSLRAEHRSEIGLLKEALSLDPEDRLAASRLLKAIAWQLEYAIHEIPAGVLVSYGLSAIDGCAELMLQLGEFEQLAVRCDQTSSYQDLIDECRLHFREYAKYASGKTGFGSYAEYLESIGFAG